MSTFSIPAHFDGERIVLDVPVDLQPDTRLLVTVLTAQDEERQGWLELSAQGLEQAYGGDEPEYTIESVKELNPDYAGG
jgi:hypothetical protein